MVFLDYTTQSFSIVNGGSGSLYTTSYKCMITLELTSTSGLPIGSSTGNGYGIWYQFGETSNYRQYLAYQVDQANISNTSWFRGGSVIVGSGESIQYFIAGGDGNTNGVLHIFRLPESA